MVHTAAVDRSLRALADENRRAILSTVRESALPVGEIAQQLGLSQQTTSHHLKVLRDAGLVAEHREGARHLFAVDPGGFHATREFLEQFWPGKLAALRDAVEADLAARHG